VNTTAIDVVLSYFARCADRDASIVEMYTEDAEFFDCVGPSLFTGHAEIREHVFEPIFTAFPDFRCDDQVRHIVSDRNVVMAELVITGTHEAHYLGHPPTHRQVSWNTSGVWEITDDGLIRREAFYWDAATLTAQLRP